MAKFSGIRSCATLLLLLSASVAWRVVLSFTAAPPPVPPQPLLCTIDNPAHCTHAIIVAGHAIFLPLELRLPLADDKHWLLQSFQRGEGEVFLSHCRKGIALLRADPAALLILSGGETRSGAEGRSEASGYLDAIAAMGLLLGGDNVGRRIVLEEYARDSFENLLFSICAFSQRIRRVPLDVTVVTWNFKAQRLQQHARAIGVPHVRVEGGDAEPSAPSAVTLAAEARARAGFAADPFGANPPLSVKREGRNPFQRVVPYLHDDSCPSLAHALRRAEGGAATKERGAGASVG